jgi:hypothetical protein
MPRHAMLIIGDLLMARKLPLRTVLMANGSAPPLEFNYGETMLMLLRQGSPGRGLTLDEVLRCVEAMEPLEAAIQEKADQVTFTETQFGTLLGKLDGFSWTIADRVIAEFGLAIRQAPEIT